MYVRILVARHRECTRVLSVTSDVVSHWLKADSSVNVLALLKVISLSVRLVLSCAISGEPPDSSHARVCCTVD